MSCSVCTIKSYLQTVFFGLSILGGAAWVSYIHTDVGSDCPPPPKVTSLSEWVDEAASCVVNVNGATGFFVTENGYLLTNQHVVGLETEATIRFQDGIKKVGQVVARDAVSDIALIKVDGGGYPSVTFSSIPISIGDRVYSFGCPASLDWTLGAGYVSHIGRTLPGVPDAVNQMDMGSSPGSSGSPVFNASGKVVGIVRAVWMTPLGQADNVTFTVTSKQIVQFLLTHLP